MEAFKDSKTDQMSSLGKLIREDENKHTIDRLDLHNPITNIKISL